jgi:hypothetical protein
LLFAKAIALAAGAQSIEAEHLLAGALYAWSDAGSLRDEIFRRIGVVDPELPGPADSIIPFSRIVTGLLNDGIAQANRLGHHRKRPQHFLLALLDKRSCAASGLLHDAGVTRELLLESTARHVLEDDSPLPYRAYLRAEFIPAINRE